MRSDESWTRQLGRFQIQHYVTGSPYQTTFQTRRKTGHITHGTRLPMIPGDNQVSAGSLLPACAGIVFPSGFPDHFLFPGNQLFVLYFLSLFLSISRFFAFPACAPSVEHQVVSPRFPRHHPLRVPGGSLRQALRSRSVGRPIGSHESLRSQSLRGGGQSLRGPRR